MKAEGYRGQRQVDGPIRKAEVFRIGAKGAEEPFPQRVVYHSPDGYEWGYGGSGPSDLALNMLLDAMLAEELIPDGDFSPENFPADVWVAHQDFKWAFIANFGDSWKLMVPDIIRWWRGREL